MDKTNALRTLDKAKIPYQLHHYESNGIAKDALEVSMLIHQPSEKVYKTLVTIGASKARYVLVINGADELDLKKAAMVLGEKNLELIPVASLLNETGYVRGGCSPIGLKKVFPVFFDDQVKTQTTIIVSAGRIGLQMEIEVEQLLKAAHGKVADLVQQKPQR